ncbi:MAG: hypothetical protein EA409_01945 [Saprospirales bacterium]|nr:MAG: hypothetical protein EA409_01945 [Saprospirales bacterium]
MKLQTKVNIEPSGLTLGYHNQYYCLGSCFAENVMNYLRSWKFSVEGNPFGIVYNPISIGRQIESLCKGILVENSELFFHQGLYHHFGFHGNFSDPNADEALKKMNESLELGRRALLNADLLIITFGTAYGFYHRTDDQLVSNCHKIPGGEFYRYRSSPAQIRECLHQSLSQLVSINKELKIIFTLSPVRHIRDGLIENNRSKSALMLSIDELLKDFERRAFYFPSYEIVMDELRDYRFYESDLVHIRKEALEYIMERFSEFIHSESAFRMLGEVKTLIRDANHRPLHPTAEPHREFVRSRLKKLEKLGKQLPNVDFSTERDIFSAQFRPK